MGKLEFQLFTPRPMTVMEKLKAVVTSRTQCQNTVPVRLPPFCLFLITSIFTFSQERRIDYKGFTYLKATAKALQFIFGSSKNKTATAGVVEATEGSN